MQLHFLKLFLYHATFISPVGTWFIWCTALFYQIDSSTIDGNVNCVHSVQLYSDVTSVNVVFAFDKNINNSDNFRTKCVSYSKISAIWCVLNFLFLHFLYNLGKHVKEWEKISFFLLKELSFCHNIKFSNSLSLQLNVVDLGYFILLILLDILI